jgi:hypothetical protein
LRDRSTSFKPAWHCGIGWRDATPDPDRPRGLGFKIGDVLWVMPCPGGQSPEGSSGFSFFRLLNGQNLRWRGVNWYHHYFFFFHLENSKFLLIIPGHACVLLFVNVHFENVLQIQK